MAWSNPLIGVDPEQTPIWGILPGEDNAAYQARLLRYNERGWEQTQPPQAGNTVPLWNRFPGETQSDYSSRALGYVNQNGFQIPSEEEALAGAPPVGPRLSIRRPLGMQSPNANAPMRTGLMGDNTTRYPQPTEEEITRGLMSSLGGEYQTLTAEQIARMRQGQAPAPTATTPPATTETPAAPPANVVPGLQASTDAPADPRLRAVPQAGADPTAPSTNPNPTIASSASARSGLLTEPTATIAPNTASPANAPRNGLLYDPNDMAAKIEAARNEGRQQDQQPVDWGRAITQIAALSGALGQRLTGAERAAIFMQLPQLQRQEQQDRIAQQNADRQSQLAKSRIGIESERTELLRSQLTQQEARRNNMLRYFDLAPGASGSEAPVSNGSAPGSVSSGTGTFADRIIRGESAGDTNARNPRSSATGLGQFIDDTWLQFARENPRAFEGMNAQQILAQRTNPDLNRQAIDWYARRNAGDLRNAGIEANDRNLALAHGFGSGGAIQLIRANSSNPDAPVSSVFNDRVISANPELRNMTVAQAIAQRTRNFRDAPASGGSPVVNASATSTAPSNDSSDVTVTAGSYPAYLRSTGDRAAMARFAYLTDAEQAREAQAWATDRNRINGELRRDRLNDQNTRERDAMTAARQQEQARRGVTLGLDGKALEESQAQATAARNNITNYQALGRLANDYQVNGGFTSAARAFVDRQLVSLGIGSADTVSRLSSRDAFEAIRQHIISTARTPGTGSVSDADARRLDQAQADLRNGTINVNEYLAIQTALQNRVISRSDAQREFFETRGSLRGFNYNPQPLFHDFTPQTNLSEIPPNSILALPHNMPPEIRQRLGALPNQRYIYFGGPRN